VAQISRAIETPRESGAMWEKSPREGHGVTFVYDLTIDPEAENNTHAFSLKMIGQNKSVLEVGCATGYFTKALVERGCKVVGMELDPEAAKLAESFAERVVVGDADGEDIWENIDDETFDVISFGDVLEHLKDPLPVLRMAKRKLKPTGFIVTSLPNVAHGDVRLSLLHGKFQYREIGLLDRTHIRFFTFETIHEMMREAGLVVIETERVIMPLFSSELGVKREDFSEAVIDEIRAGTEYETYQFVMKSVIDNGSQAVLDMAARLGELSSRASMLASDKRATLDELGRVSDHVADLTSEVIRLRDELSSTSTHTDELEQSIESLTNTLDATQQAYQEYERLYYQIRNSKSFRAMAPLRQLRTVLGRR
jgi:2-polyprenyl-3-methyl-5-hydroxy-6-metoxy-1,4-benzoquinol methylase